MPLHHSDNVEIPYKRGFEYNELQEKKLYLEYDDDTTRSAKVYKFDEELGIEALLMIEEQFKQTMREEFEQTEGNAVVGRNYFRLFEKILMGNSRDQWRQLVSGIAENRRTVAEFDNVMKQFQLLYCSSQARDKLIQYLQTVRKPVKVNPRAHSSRMQQLALYANRLPGDLPALTDTQIKVAIFNSFPDSWKRAYSRKSTRIANDNLQDIVAFMANEKEIADAEQANRKRDKKTASDDDSESGKKKKGKKKSKKNTSEDNNAPATGRNAKCRKHPQGNHTWWHCFENPRGPNYQRNRNRNENGGNRDNNRNTNGNNNYNRNGQGNRTPSGNRNANYYQQPGNEGRDDQRHDVAGSTGNEHHYNAIGVVRDDTASRISWSPATTDSYSRH